MAEYWRGTPQKGEHWHSVAEPSRIVLITGQKWTYTPYGHRNEFPDVQFICPDNKESQSLELLKFLREYCIILKQTQQSISDSTNSSREPVSEKWKDSDSRRFSAYEE